jgi:hypothetical protein
MSIYDVIVKRKQWTSKGGVLLPAGGAATIRVGYYPSVGVTYEVKDQGTIPSEDKTVPAWEHNSEVITPVRTAEIRTLKFKVLEPGHYPNVSNKFPPQGLLNSDFKKKFENMLFMERGEYLVSRPIIITDKNINAGQPLAVYFTIELYQRAGHTSMIQRAYWSDGYTGSYCCP